MKGDSDRTVVEVWRMDLKKQRLKSAEAHALLSINQVTLSPFYRLVVHHHVERKTRPAPLRWSQIIHNNITMDTIRY